LLLTRQGRAGTRAVATFFFAGMFAAVASPYDSWVYWTQYIHDPQRAGMLSWIGNQGLLGAIERILGHTVTTSTTFAIVVVAGAIGLAVGAAACRRSSPVLGLLVIEATESLANPVSWSHHFIWVVLLVAWLALAQDRPRYGECWALAVCVLFWAAPTWWVPHGASIVFAGRGWLIPLANSYVLLFIMVVAGAGFRVVRTPLERVLAGRRTMAPSGASA
jgi:alpha-1,2-mannosyltransferase